MKQQGIAKAKRGRKERPTVAERLGIHKFRVTYCLRVDGKENETTFLYHDLRAARRNYKSILLELYRKRDLDLPHSGDEPFAIIPHLQDQIRLCCNRGRGRLKIGRAHV